MHDSTPRPARWLVWLLVAALALSSTGALAAPATDADPSAASHARYFSETGFWVADPFLTFWEQNGGLMTFGLPLSRVFYQDGVLRQYFERAVFERHDEFAGTPYEVLVMRLGALGTTDRQAEAPFQPISGASPGCTYFPETSHQLCGVFLDYWQAHGGLAVFGYPISEPFSEVSRTDGKSHRVQYFERARFEYHPENTPPNDVLLGLLGREALKERAVPPAAVKPESSAGPPSAPLGPQPLYANRHVDCGFNFVWWGDLNNRASNEYFLDLARDSGCRWIRMQAQWSEIEYQRGYYAFYAMGLFVDAARARGLKILVTVDHAPTWAAHPASGVPADPELFGQFMGALAREFRGRVDAWQLWNEPNLAYEANGTIDENGYFAMVKAAAGPIRASDPNARIVLAGLAPNSLRDRNWAYDDVDYLRALLAIDHGAIRNYIDVVGIHSYGAGNSPDNYWPSNLAHTPGWNNAPEFYFRHAEELHNTLTEAGMGDLPMWLTEFGWTTKNAWPDYGYGDWVSPDDQARYLARAFEIARTEWPWMQAMFVFSLNSAIFQGEGGPYFGFSLTDQYGKPRPAYDAIAKMPK